MRTIRKKVFMVRCNIEASFTERLERRVAEKSHTNVGLRAALFELRGLSCNPAHRFLESCASAARQTTAAASCNSPRSFSLNSSSVSFFETIVNVIQS